MSDHYVERYYGGGTTRVVSLLESDPMAASARFLALEREASRLMNECHRLTDEAIDANAVGHTGLARDLVRQGNVCLQEANKLRKEMAR